MWVKFSSPCLMGNKLLSVLFADIRFETSQKKFKFDHTLWFDDYISLNGGLLRAHFPDLDLQTRISAGCSQKMLKLVHTTVQLKLIHSLFASLQTSLEGTELTWYFHSWRWMRECGCSFFASLWTCYLISLTNCMEKWKIINRTVQENNLTTYEKAQN